MKKTVSILLCMLLATTLLAACSSGYSGGMDAPAAAPAPEMPEDAPASDYDSSYGESEVGGFDVNDTLFTEPQDGGIMPVSAPAAEGLAEKIIYSVTADIETIKFDDTIAMVNSLLGRYGAFIETSSIRGRNYASNYGGWTEYRYAHFALRVPKEQLDAITANLDSLGNVTNLSTNAENITAQFLDTQSRLNSLKIQEERLLDMLKKAEDVPDLITIEERLSEVRYQIESITSLLRNWQNQVDYSYLTLSISEVEEFTEITEIHRTYWQQIGDGFMSTLNGVGRFFMDFFKWLIIAAPVLVILAVIAVVVLIITRRVIRSSEKKRSELQKNMAAYPSTPAYPNASTYAPPPYQTQAPATQAPAESEPPAPAPAESVTQSPEHPASDQSGEDK